MNCRNPFKNCCEIGEGVSNARYMKQTVERGNPSYVMSRSALMEFAQCPHKWIQTPDRDSTKALDWGSLVDCLLFTPSEFDEQFVLSPATYTNGKGKEMPWTLKSDTCQEWKDEKEQAGLIVITQTKLREAGKAVEVLKADKKVSALLGQSRFQVMIAGNYKDHETGLVIPCKTLQDIQPDSQSIHGSALADLKTGYDATAQKWSRKVNDFDYDAQAAMELDMFNAESGQERDQFLHIVQESDAPYEIGRRTLSHEFLEIGRHKYLSALRLYAWCLKNNEWPGYDDTTNEFENGWRLTQPEPWMMKDCPFVIPQRENQLTQVEEHYPAN